MPSKPFNISLLERVLGSKSNKSFASLTEIVPDLTEKTVIITGGNSGIGKVSALEFARKGAHVILACRSKEKALPVVDEIKKETNNQNVEFGQLDLSDWASVKAFAANFMAKNEPLHILLNNAGIMAPPKYGKCKQDMEIQMSGNHFGHFLLTRELLPALKKAGKGARIVNVSSLAHGSAHLKPAGFMSQTKGFDFDHFNDPAFYGAQWNYGHSKLANILFTIELQKRLEEAGINDIYCNCLHPGVIATNLAKGSIHEFGFNLTSSFYMTPEQGAMTQIYVSTHPDIVDKNIKGQYFVPYATLSKSNPAGRDFVASKKLWEFTQNYLEQKGFAGNWAI